MHGGEKTIIANTHFYILNNGILSSEGMSGSDQRALNWGSIFANKGCRVTIIIPEAGEERYKNFDYIVIASGRPRHGTGLALDYLLRGIRTAYKMSTLKTHMTANTVIYSSSDLLPDTIPAIYTKIRNPDLKWITGLHLMAPNPFKGFEKTTTDGYTIPTISNIYYFLTQRLIMVFMKRYAHTVMVSNNLDRGFLLRNGFSPDKVLVTYGAVDWQNVNKSVKKEPVYDACYIGRFHKQKGFPDLIEAWKQVCKRYPRAVIAIVGNDTNFNEVVENVRNKGLSENIKFLGFLNGVEKFNVMKSSKLCVFPSTHESFGIVVAEAMACGLPVVAYDLPVFREIYPAGMLRTPTGDVSALADNIIGILSNEGKKERNSEEAFELSKRFTWEKTAEDILQRLN